MYNSLDKPIFFKVTDMLRGKCMFSGVDKINQCCTELKKAIDEAGMPEDVLKNVRKEFKRLARMGESSGEASMLRTWLEWMTELPWKAEPQKAIDIDRKVPAYHRNLGAAYYKLKDYDIRD